MLTLPSPVVETAALTVLLPSMFAPERVTFAVWSFSAWMVTVFSVELPAHMANLLGCLFRYTFLVMDREHFRQACREYEIDKDIARKCLSRDTNCIVVYTGMTRIG